MGRVYQGGGTGYIDTGAAAAAPPLPVVGATQFCFVFRPADPAGNHANVYVDWPAMLAAIALVDGAKLILIDASFTSPAVPAGAWNVQDCTFVSRDRASSGLTFLPGATLTGTKFGLDNVSFDGTTTVYEATPGVTSTITLDHSSAIVSSAAHAFLSVPVAATLQLFVDEVSILGDGVDPAVTVEVSATLLVVLTGGSQLAANALEGPGEAVILMEADSHINTPQTAFGGTLSVQTFTNSASFANTSEIPNSTVPQFDVPFTTKTGKIRITGSMGVAPDVGSTAVAGDNILFALLLDGVALPPTAFTEVSSGSKVAGATLCWEVAASLLAGNPHTVSIRGTFSPFPAHTITVPVGGASINVRDI